MSLKTGSSARYISGPIFQSQAYTNPRSTRTSHNDRAVQAENSVKSEKGNPG